jgi:hypothetical protein
LLLGESTHGGIDLIRHVLIDFTFADADASL